MHPSLCCSSTDIGLDMSVLETLDSFLHPPCSVSLSQPCLPVANLGPTKILPYLFLGSQSDAHCKETMAQNGITYVLNVSVSSPRPTFIQDGHFLRIPVNDGYSDKLSPFFCEAFKFLDKVREANGCVLVHCLAGVSRSPTIAIAYIMHSLKMTMDEAYRYVKDKRPTISPNFNFLGQLLDYEKQLTAREPDETEGLNEEVLSKKQRTDHLHNTTTKPNDSCHKAILNFSETHATSNPSTLTSPTTALARLNFCQLSPLREQPSPSAADSRLDVSSNSATLPVASNVLIRLGPKHCGTKRPLSDPGNGSHIAGKNDHEEINKKRPLMRPNSINFSPSMGARQKLHALSSLWSPGQQTRSDDFKAGLEELSSPLSDKKNLDDETQSLRFSSQFRRHAWPPGKEDKLAEVTENYATKASAGQHVGVIFQSKTFTSRPNKLTPAGKHFMFNTTDRIKESTFKPEPSADLINPTASLSSGAAVLDVPFRTKVEKKRLVGTTWPSDVTITLDVEKDCDELPQVVMARKSRSLDDILNCPFPYEVRNSSGHGLLYKCQGRSSYLINVLVSPATLELDKHIICCETKKPDSFQSPSSTDSLEMIPVS